MRRPIYIFGAGGLGREILALIHSLEMWEPRGFVDDNVERGKVIKGLPVIGGISEIARMGVIDLVIAIGDPLLKKQLALRLPGSIRFPVLIHPRATLLAPESITIGRGSIVAAGAVLTSDIIISEHVLINLNTTVGHDTGIGKYASIMPGVNIAGEVNIGEAVLLGSGCNIRNRITVGPGSRVGMGAVVINDVKEGETVMGIPAKPKTTNKL